jgi:hypothetical protein
MTYSDVMKGNGNTKSLAFTSLVRAILEYGAGCGDPYREGKINALDVCKRKRLNLQTIRMIRSGKPWRSVER